MPTAQNKILLQSFEWHTPSPHPQKQQSHYALLTSLLPSLSQLGITSLWLPPGCKANDPSGKGNGYDCYDLWDLGEFDQKWRREVKWGSKGELERLVEKAREMGAPGGGEEGGGGDGEGVEVVWDAVLSHKTAGDDVEETWAVEVDPNGTFLFEDDLRFSFLHNSVLSSFRKECGSQADSNSLSSFLMLILMPPRSPPRNLLPKSHQSMAEIRLPRPPPARRRNGVFLLSMESGTFQWHGLG
jgi:hypothetical protein